MVEAQIDSLLGTQATLTMQLTKTEDSRAAMQTELTTKLSKLTSRVDERVDELTGSQAALSMQVVKANDSRAATQQELSSKLEELRQKVEEQIDSLVGAQASCTMQLARLGDLATKLEPLTQSNLQVRNEDAQSAPRAAHVRCRSDAVLSHFALHGPFALACMSLFVYDAHANNWHACPPAHPSSHMPLCACRTMCSA